ncbi:MAG: hypothetical protein JXQ72_17370 [Anaerolineae bacterium]|nr:hypothetical protein [Anaerolineae bacterium]
MKTRILCLFTLVCALVLSLIPVIPPAAAQDGGARYEAPTLGIAFELPAGWQVQIERNQLIAAAPDDLNTIQAGGTPAGLVLRIITGTFNELGITDADQIPAQLAKLVPGTVTPPAPEPVAWGGGSGYQVLVQLPEGLTTRVGLLAITGGRIAIVRGMAPGAVWDGGAGAQFDTLTGSLEFMPPTRQADYLDAITSNDGGVLWHYQEAQPSSGRAVQLGGIVYDMFDLMYIAAGPGGILVLEMSTGGRVSFMGPWFDGNFVDVAIGPDTKLYLANTAEDTQAAVMVVDRAGNWLRGWGIRGDGDGQFAPGMPQTIAVTPSGDVWTVSEGHSSGITNRLYRFDSVGNLRQTVDLAALNDALSGVHIDAHPRTGGLFLVGATGYINEVDTDGQPLVVNLAQEALAGTTPVDIAVAPNNNLIVALDAPGLDGFGLLELGPSGVLLDVFGFPYDPANGDPFLAGDYLRPRGLVVGSDGLPYWTETHPATGYSQVQRFTFTGDGLLPLGSERVESADAPEGALTVDPAFGGGTLAYGQVVFGALNNRYPAHNWTFEGTAGEHIVITMKDASGAGLLDPKLVLKNSEGLEIAVNDDVGAVRPEGLAARDSVIDFALPSTGVFTIQAGRFGGRGEYILTLDRVE